MANTILTTRKDLSQELKVMTKFKKSIFLDLLTVSIKWFTVKKD